MYVMSVDECFGKFNVSNTCKQCFRNVNVCNEWKRVLVEVYYVEGVVKSAFGS